MSLRSWALSNFLWIHGKAIHAEAESESECINSWPELNCYAFGLFGLNPILHFEQQKQKNTRLIDRFQTSTTDKLLTIASESSTETEHLLFTEHLLEAQNYLIILPMLSSPSAGPTANSKSRPVLSSSAFYSGCNWDSPKWRSLFGITQLLRVELRFEHSLQMQNPKMIPAPILARLSVSLCDGCLGAREEDTEPSRDAHSHHHFAQKLRGPHNDRWEKVISAHKCNDHRDQKHRVRFSKMLTTISCAPFCVVKNETKSPIRSKS